ncbi:uncharacterized protein LOC131954698 [Physella acuta]|uniref:uncharacterized protein LOC131954698 n=1 Tax=Physella acuta TaxID=109671 RepID=UPI0027DC0702|nr:uncharacterized protein LOC131954698 [Physella acuta]
MACKSALPENYGHTPTSLSDVPTSEAHTNESEVTDLLGVIYEIFHAMLLVDCYRSGASISSNNALKCSLCIRSKIKATHNELMMFSVKATCNRLVLFMDYLRGQGMPALQHLICKMQTLEKESHLAIQEVDESNNKKTSALWLDPSTPDCVTILSEKQEPVKETDDMKSIIQMRVFMHKSSITLCSIEICDLLERIKFINPQVELSFMMNQGISFELTLCRFPCNMKIVNENLDLSPHTLVEWQHFGFQVKKHFKSSSYTTECSARMFHTERLPKWTEECELFNLTLAFVITGDDVLSNQNQLSISKNDIPQNEQRKVLYCLSKGTYSIFQESAKSSLDELFGKSKENQEEVCSKNSDEDIFVKMIPEITNSLVDIFTRSTNTDFRSEVNNLVPTSSRITMCNHIERKLWNVIKKPVPFNSPELPTHSDVLVPKPSILSENQNPNDESELPIDDWEFSDDSLDAEEIGALSPDSLNYESGEEDISEPGHFQVRSEACTSGKFNSSETVGQNSASAEQIHHANHVRNRSCTSGKFSPCETVGQNSESAKQVYQANIEQALYSSSSNSDVTKHGTSSKKQTCTGNTNTYRDDLEVPEKLTNVSRHKEFHRKTLSHVTINSFENYLEKKDSFHHKTSKELTYPILENDQAHILHDPTAVLNNSNTTSSTRIPLNNMNQDGKTITLAPTTDQRQPTGTPVFENAKSTSQSLPSMPRKRSSEFSMNMEDSGNPPDSDALHVQTTPCEDFKKKKLSNLAQSLDLHCREQSCHLEQTLDTSAVQPIPQCCKQVDESDWFDEDEVAQWFAEMED